MTATVVPLPQPSGEQHADGVPLAGVIARLTRPYDSLNMAARHWSLMGHIVDDLEGRDRVEWETLATSVLAAGAGEDTDWQVRRKVAFAALFLLIEDDERRSAAADQLEILRRACP